MSRGETLFFEYDLHSLLQGSLQKARDAVDTIEELRFTQATDADIVEHVYSEYEVVPLELYEDRKEMETDEIKVDVRHDFTRAIFDESRPCLVAGTRITVTVRFTGDDALWKCRPNRFTLNPPRATIRKNRDGSGLVELRYEQATDSLGDGKAVKNEIDRTISGILEYIGNMRNEIEEYNRNLRITIGNAVESRRKRLGMHGALVNMLGIPLKRRSGAPDTIPLPIKRKMVRPLPASSGRPAEPGIRTEDYEHILGVIRHEGRSFETAPATFAKHDEEELREFILAHLNGHYQGDATGETFRKHGKTDIRIEDSDRAAFVAECKVWHGQAGVSEAVDQLLGYLTWRDCKAALVIFNKSVAGFVAVQEKLRQTVSSHIRHEAALPCEHAGEWRFRFRSTEDTDHKIELHVFLFNLFTSVPK